MTTSFGRTLAQRQSPRWFMLSFKQAKVNPLSYQPSTY
jgi:hypothetical protein